MTDTPRLIFCRESTALETAALIGCWNEEYQCFGPLPSTPFPDAQIVVHREGEEPIAFKLYEVDIKLRPQGMPGFRPGKAPDMGSTLAYVYARDYENFRQFCERILGIEVVGKVDDGT